ncbi:MAG TPA: DUF6186 family protein [Aldersonia sp.]
MITTAGFTVVALAAVVLFVASARGWFGLCSVGALLDVVRATTAWRVALLAGWAWLGWHLLAR